MLLQCFERNCITQNLIFFPQTFNETIIAQMSLLKPLWRNILH